MELDVEALLDKLQQQIAQHIAALADQEVLLVGIHTGGYWLAERLHQALAIESPLCSLNISFYRDDFTRIGLHPEVKPSNLPVSLDGKHLILIDDVLYTGRTVRAALNELFDYGRPASVALAALVDRGGRELPICANFVGHQVTLDETQQIKLNGPEPLSLSLAVKA